MAEKDEIKVIIDVEIQKALKNYDKVRQRETQTTKGILDGAKKIKLAYVAVAGVIGGALVGAIVKASKKAGEFEQLNIAFTTFLGSAQKAKTAIKDLQDFASATPFETEKVNSAAKSLLAFGTAQEDLIPTIKTLGDISAGTGKDLQELSVIYGQIKSTGRLLGQDLLQLINSGFNPLQQISEDTGKSVKDLKDEMSKGNITFEQVEQAFKNATTEGGRFFDLTQKQSKSFLGRLSTLRSNIDIFTRDVAGNLVPTFGKVVDGLNSLLTGQPKLKTSTEALATATDKYSKAVKDATVNVEDLNEEQQKQVENQLTLTRFDFINNLEKVSKGYKQTEARARAYEKSLREGNLQLQGANRTYTESVKALNDYKLAVATAREESSQAIKDYKAGNITLEEYREILNSQNGVLGRVTRRTVEYENAVKVARRQLERTSKGVKASQEGYDKYSDAIKESIDGLLNAVFVDKDALALIRAKNPAIAKLIDRHLEYAESNKDVATTTEEVTEATEENIESTDDYKRAVAQMNQELEDTKKAHQTIADRIKANKDQIKGELLNIASTLTSGITSLISQAYEQTAQENLATLREQTQILLDEVDRKYLEDKKAIEDEYRQQREEDDQAELDRLLAINQEDLTDYERVQLRKQIADKQAQIAREKLDNEEAKRLKDLETQKEADKLAIEEDAKEKRLAIEKKLFEQKKKLDLASIAINSAVAIMKAWAQNPITAPFVTGGIVAAGILSAVKVQRQKFPAYEKGGAPTVGQTALVGEAGPELFVPTTRGNVIPNDMLREALGGAIDGVGAGNVSEYMDNRSYTFQSNASDPVEVANEIVRQYGVDAFESQGGFQ
jgi:tape measure domain-containing protein